MKKFYNPGLIRNLCLCLFICSSILLIIPDHIASVASIELEEHMFFLPLVENKYQEGTFLLEDFDGAYNCYSDESEIWLGSGFFGKALFIRKNYDVYNYPSINCDVNNEKPIYGISFWMKSSANNLIDLTVITPEGGYAGSRLRFPLPQEEIKLGNWMYYKVLFAEQLQLPEGSYININIGYFSSDHENEYPSYEDIGIDEIRGIESREAVDLSADKITIYQRERQNLHSITGIDYNQRSGADYAGISLTEKISPSFVRTDRGTWPVIEESEDDYDFSVLDRIVGLHESYGYATLLNISGGNPIYTGEWNYPPISTEELSAFGRYITALANHYKNRKVMFEIWPEPEMAIWSYRPLTALEWANILSVASDRIKSVDPAITVVSGGVLNTDFRFFMDVKYYGGFDNIDVIGTHGWNTYSYNRVSQLRWILNELGLGDLGFWNTESSAYTGLADVPKIFLLCFGMGFEGCAYWPYQNYSDDGSTYVYPWGLIDENYQFTQYYFVLERMVDLTSGKTFSGVIGKLPTNIFGITFENSVSINMLIWSEHESAVQAQVDSSCTAQNYLGNPVEGYIQNAMRIITISNQNSPIYLTCGK
jgi:hypothetical protein